MIQATSKQTAYCNINASRCCFTILQGRLATYQNLQSQNTLSDNFFILQGGLAKQNTFSDNFFILQGGLATQQEMCLSYLMYYPATPLVTCMSAVLPGSLVQVAENVLLM